MLRGHKAVARTAPPAPAVIPGRDPVKDVVVRKVRAGRRDLGDPRDRADLRGEGDRRARVAPVARVPERVPDVHEAPRVAPRPMAQEAPVDRPAGRASVARGAVMGRLVRKGRVVPVGLGVGAAATVEAPRVHRVRVKAPDALMPRVDPPAMKIAPVARGRPVGRMVRRTGISAVAAVAVASLAVAVLRAGSTAPAPEVREETSEALVGDRKARHSAARLVGTEVLPAVVDLRAVEALPVAAGRLAAGDPPAAPDRAAARVAGQEGLDPVVGRVVAATARLHSHFITAVSPVRRPKRRLGISV